MISYFPNQFLIFWTEKSNLAYFYLVWDLDVKAPISHVLNEIEISSYLDDWNCRNQMGDCLLRVHDVDQVEKSGVLKDNKAGKNGETLSWDEILRLYRK